MSKNTPKNHHYVPQHFLKAWSSSQSKIHSYRINPYSKRIEKKPAAIKRSASSENLYKLEFPDGSFEIETLIVTPELDDVGSKLLQKVRESSISWLSRDDLYQFAMYLVCLEARHPDIIAAMDISGELPERKSEFYNENMDNQEAVDQSIDYLSSSPSIGVLALGAFIKNEKLGFIDTPFTHAIMNAHIKEYTFDEPKLLCSNYPISRWGNFVDSIFMVVSISPYKALIFSSNSDVKVFDELDEDTLSEVINLYTVGKAEFAYAYEPVFDTFLQTHLGWAKLLNNIDAQKQYIGDFVISRLSKR
ncbi:MULTISPECIES: DUF4238 domain-containing protein [Vibrio]|uniref:DUF4238 domain-containing protein n=1 Tax=Vibrio TaxID=662 RepID=UPI00021A9645|nr:MULTISPECIES: DUF4238 domain-containing protein [Vibrio]EGR0744212.1 DUF4238 domain-containing protein [Vibrio cholerae]EGR0757227.1 DUF4238 domain-containing protein [Vibrio cholerae]EGR0820829.1 DUF4238 domain-containing protein [Vibrio cholerae]EGS73960.1 hypothetical protein VCBJG01_3131 [Vibrio cholerae BJG-01]EIO9265671.1 DUF4238 domain-containing protein [Vibrio alginolyticus]